MYISLEGSFMAWRSLIGFKERKASKKSSQLIRFIKSLEANPLLVSIALFVFCILATLITWNAIREQMIQLEHQKFDYISSSISDSIKKNFQMRLSVIESGCGLFTVSSEVSIAEWEEYVKKVRSTNVHAGNFQMGYVVPVMTEEYTDFTGAVLDMSKVDKNILGLYSGFRIHRVIPGLIESDISEQPILPKESDEQLSYILTYLSPLNGNEQSLGADLGYDPRRRSAINTAISTGYAAMVRPTEHISPKYKGDYFIMFMPIIREKKIIVSEEKSQDYADISSSVAISEKNTKNTLGETGVDALGKSGVLSISFNVEEFMGELFLEGIRSEKGADLKLTGMVLGDGSIVGDNLVVIPDRDITERIDDIANYNIDDLKENFPVVVQLYYGESTSDDDLIYSSDNEIFPMPKYANVMKIHVNDNIILTARYFSKDSFSLDTFRDSLPAIFLISGILFSIMITALGYSLAAFNRQTQRLADKITLELKESTERINNQNTTISLSPAIVYSLTVPNPDTIKIVSISDNISNYGYTNSDIISGKVDMNSLLSPEDYSRIIRRIISEMSSKSKGFTDQFRIFDSSGKSHWVECHNLIKYVSNTNQASCINGVLIDITERKTIEDDLMQKTIELENINKMMTGREIKMIELKQTIRRLQDELSNLTQKDEQILRGGSFNSNDTKKQI